jgi:flagellum-specific ATP synthase
MSAMPAMPAILNNPDLTRLVAPRGRIRNVVRGLVEIDGLRSPIGAELLLDASPARALRFEVVGFRGCATLAAPLGATRGIAPGAVLRESPHGASVPVGDAFLGRVVDPLGRPLDGRPAIVCGTRAPLRRSPPPACLRKPVRERFVSGIRAIDGLLPMGQGQRVGVFAGAGVGKSTLLGMFCAWAAADVIVVGLVGERGREVGDFVRAAAEAGYLHKAVIVAATSDCPPLLRVRGALAATAMAEHFRDRGKRVLLVMDSLTRVAMALRDVTLSAGEPPLTKGYTPTVFSALPELLERAGCDAGEGVITAIYTVLVEGDDMSDPVADAARSILDGHVVLSRSSADRGIFPAIDALRSVSRVARDVSTREHCSAAGRIRRLLGDYEETIDLVRVGAYVPGADARIDAARAAAPDIEAFLTQDSHEPSRLDDTLRSMLGIAGRWT